MSEKLMSFLDANPRLKAAIKIDVTDNEGRRVRGPITDVTSLVFTVGKGYPDGCHYEVEIGGEFYGSTVDCQGDEYAIGKAAGLDSRSLGFDQE